MLSTVTRTRRRRGSAWVKVCWLALPRLSTRGSAAGGPMRAEAGAIGCASLPAAAGGAVVGPYPVIPVIQAEGRSVQVAPLASLPVPPEQVLRTVGPQPDPVVAGLAALGDDAGPGGGGGQVEPGAHGEGGVVAHVAVGQRQVGGCGRLPAINAT